MRTADGPFPMETTYTWEPSGDATRLTLRNRGNPTGFSKMTAPLMELAMRRATTKDLARLKTLLGTLSQQPPVLRQSPHSLKVSFGVSPRGPRPCSSTAPVAAPRGPSGTAAVLPAVPP